MSKQTRNHSITYADLNDVIDVLIDDRTALKRGIMSLIDQAFKEGKNPPKITKQSAEEIYLEKAVKMCRYPAFLDGRYISVPIGQEQIALDDLTVSHLVNSHKFSIQPCIPDHAEVKEVFDPKFRQSTKQPEYDFNVQLPVRGEVWLNGKERWYIKSVTDVAYTITYLEDLRGDMKKSISEMEELVKIGNVVKEVR